MKVRREQLVETERFMIGDRISVELAGFGTFSATAQRVLPEGTLFLFDKCICEMPMNELPTSAGGYERTPLAAFLRSQVLDAFPAELRPRVRELTLPTYGQIFGHDEGYDEYYMPDQDQQFPPPWPSCATASPASSSTGRTAYAGTGCKTPFGRRYRPPSSPIRTGRAARARAAPRPPAASGRSSCWLCRMWTSLHMSLIKTRDRQHALLPVTRTCKSTNFNPRTRLHAPDQKYFSGSWTESQSKLYLQKYQKIIYKHQ